MMRTIGRRGVRRTHSDTMIGAATAASRSIQGKPNHSAAKASGPRITADATRSSSPRNRAGATGMLGADAAIPPLAFAELGDRLLEMLLAEIRPQGVDEHEFGVGALPEKEIADALLAACANEQIRIGDARRQELALEARFVDLVDRNLSRRDLAREIARRPQDLVARAVIDTDVDVDARVGASTCLGVGDVLLDILGQAVAIADHAQLRAVASELFEFVPQVVAQQSHQIVDLVGRARPVLGREGEQRQDRNAELASAANDFAYRVGAPAVTGDAWQPPRLRPSPIAVHDDGDVLWTR